MTENQKYMLKAFIRLLKAAARYFDLILLGKGDKI
jgi:hypothetical protein